MNQRNVGPGKLETFWPPQGETPARVGILTMYLLGAVGGIWPCLTEWLATGSAPSMSAVSGFSLVGGISAVAVYAVARTALTEETASRLSVTGIGILVALELLFLLNVVLLPTQAILAPRSLAASLAIAGLVVGGTAALGGCYAAFGRRHARVLGVLGATTALLSVIPVAARWPTDRTVPAREGQGPNILLIVIDSARRDHLTVYGYNRATSPFLSGVASSARVYGQAFAASSMTRASVPVMLSIHRPANDRTESIQHLLAQAGYRSASFSDNPVLEEGSQVAAAFDYVALGVSRALQFPQRVFDGTFVGTFVLRWPLLAHLWDDERLTTKAIAWASQAGGPLFLYVHLMDAHMPYDSAPMDGRSWSGRRIENPRPGMQLAGSEVAEIIAHYDGGLRNGDEQVARLLRAAATWGRPYLAIVTSDHGESLGENDRWGHARDLSPERLAVPMIVVGEGVLPGRVDLPVGHRSVGRTILEAAGIPCDDCVGSDLRSSEGDAVVEGVLPPDLFFRISEGYKLIWNASSGQRRLYSLTDDPLETHDLAARQPDIVARLLGDGFGRFGSSHASPEDLERFRALGYLGP